MFGHSKTLNKLLDQLLDVHKMNSERLDLLSERLDNLSKMFDTVDLRLDAINMRLDSLDKCADNTLTVLEKYGKFAEMLMEKFETAVELEENKE